MKNGKKLLSMILALVLVLSLLPVQALAQVAETMVPDVAPQIPELDISYINPNIPESLIPELPQWGESTNSQQPKALTGYTDAYGLRYAIRDAMIAREEQFTVRYTMFYNPDWSEEIFSENLNNTLLQALEGAFEESSLPKGGDYLNFHLLYYKLNNLELDDLVSNYLYLSADFEVGYLSTAAQEEAVDEAVEDLLTDLKLSGKSDYEKVRAVYDYMTENIVYDYAALEDPNELTGYTAYGALVEGESVCQGYASLFYRMMKEAGVGVRVLSGLAFNGEATEGHAWNIVELDDKYYHADSTWDASLSQAGYDYEYFLKGKYGFPDHYRDAYCDSADFHSRYPMAEDDYTIAEDVDLFEIAFANMTLGNSLAMSFAVEQGHRDDWTGCYAEIVKEYADSRPNKEITIPYAQWGSAGINGVKHFTLKFDGVAAKEMSDNVYVTIYDAKGNAISNTWEDSVRGYAMRTLNNPKTSEESFIMVVDLLNYGAAAQSYFKYNTGDLANNQMTAAQKAKATKDAPAADIRVKGANYKGTNLGLESQILMRMAFGGTNTSMYAVIEFTNHSGNKVKVNVSGSEFGSTGAITIDELVLADGRRPVTVTIYNADGSIFASATDSMESYIARMRRDKYDPLFEAILKFSDSAYNFFH